MRQLIVTWSVVVVPLAASAAFAQSPPPFEPAAAPSADALVVPDAPAPTGGEAGDGETATPAEEPSPREALALPTFFGPVGLLRVSTAEVGAPGQLRLGLAAEYFAADSFLVERDENRRLGGAFAIGYTPTRNLELFASLLGSSNRNRRQCSNGTCTSEPGRTDPEVIRSLGDVVLGAKGAWPAAPSSALSLGVQAGVRLMSSSTGLSVDPSATSFFADALGTYDFARAPAALPIAAHLDVGFYADNSSELEASTSASRPSQLVSSFAYGVQRSRVRTALGLEARAALGGTATVVPFAEYHLEYVTAGSDPRFRDFLPPACATTGAAAAGQQRCADGRAQQWATFGARLQARGGLALLAALDLGITSVGFPYGPPIAPFQVVFGLAAPLETAPRSAPAATRTIVVDKPQPSPEGHVAGTVRNARTNVPIADAIVTVVGRPRARYATEADGGYASGPLAPGELELDVDAAGFERVRARATVAAGQTTRVDVALAPKPDVAPAAAAPEQAKVHGRLTTTKGKALVGAIVRFVGATTVEAKTDPNGSYALALPPGAYSAHAEAGTAFAKDIKATFPAGEDRDLSFTLRPRPATPSVQLAGDRVTLRRAIAWKPGPPGTPLELAPASEQMLDEVADLMSRDRSIRTLVIESHWDDSLDAAKALDVTKRQSQIVMDYLVAAGVAPERVQAQGLGGEHPVVPNLGPANRARNRRIELRVVRENRL